MVEGVEVEVAAGLVSIGVTLGSNREVLEEEKLAGLQTQIIIVSISATTAIVGLTFLKNQKALKGQKTGIAL